MARPLICYVTEYYPPFGAGGAERTCSLHAQVLVRAGYPVTVITPNYGAAPRENVGGVEVVRFPFPKRLTEIGEQVSERWFSNPYYHWQLARHIASVLSSRDVLCIHAQNTHSLVGAYLAARRLSMPLVTHIRDMNGICALGATCLLEAETRPPASCSLAQHARCYLQRNCPLYMPGSTMARRLAGLMLSLPASYLDFGLRQVAHRSAKRIAFASRGLMELYQQLDGFQSADKYRVVYAPVFEENVPSDAESALNLSQKVQQLKKHGHQMILYVGKVSKGKGSDVLFAAHRQLLSRLPDVYLVVAGNVTGTTWEYDRDRTLFLGFVERDEVRALYQACDLVVAPSTWPEPLARAILEAAQNSRPIVATRVGGTPEAVIHGVTGLLVERLDVGGLERAMYDLLLDEARKEEMGRRAHGFAVERFGECAVACQLEDLYRDLR